MKAFWAEKLCILGQHITNPCLDEVSNKSMEKSMSIICIFICNSKRLKSFESKMSEQSSRFRGVPSLKDCFLFRSPH